MQKIDRGDMLELTRRMTVKRNCFHRIAGAYLDADGFIDGTFNIHSEAVIARSGKEPEDCQSNSFFRDKRRIKIIPFFRRSKKAGEYLECADGAAQL